MPLNDDVSPALQALSRGLYNERLLNQLGLGAVRLIRERTRRGQGLDGAFQAYSKGYARLKDQADGTSSDTVTLEYGVKLRAGTVVVNRYDSMLSKLESKADTQRDQVYVRFSQPRAEQIARYHQIDGAGKSKVKRRFFGLTELDAQKLGRLVEDDVKKLLAEIDRFRSS
ncbi:MAG: hypothetical protein AAFV01_14115 [Bacteroidota bacterium]